MVTGARRPASTENAARKGGFPAVPYPSGGASGYDRHMNTPPLRQPCPPGVCICGHRELLAAAQGDRRILLLTRHEERRLLARLEGIRELADLQRLQRRMYEQLGLRLSVEPGHHEVRSVRGLHIQLAEQPGLCRKTRKAVPAAVRRALEAHPEIAWRLLDSFDLLRDA